ncbi:MAG: conserved secreted protein family [Microbacteriaceae bacterium]|nr:conserved secreted protein family [Microbacteriaceae bacterium]
MSLSVDALQKGEKYNETRIALDAASTRADTLAAEADAATVAAQESADRAGQLVSQLVRTSGTNLTVQLVVDGGRADDLLYKLGTVSKLTEQSAVVLRQAEADSNTARALTSQAAVARDRTETLADDAEEVLAQANAAAEKAQAKIAKQAASAERLQAQLVALTGTADAAEQAYRDGVAWEHAHAAKPATPAAGAPVVTTPPGTTPPATTPPGGTPPVVTPPVASPPVAAPPVVVPPVAVPPVVTPPVITPPVVTAPSGGAVAAAIAFAKAQLGEPYLLNGAGPDRWDCSGLTMKSYAAAGVNIGAHLVSSQYNTMARAGRLLPVANRQAGDLLFYANSGGFYHVAMYIGGGQMIEAPNASAPVRIVAVRKGDLVGQAGRPTG